jgi:hypothetical protein
MKIPREVPQNFDSDGFGLDERNRSLCPGHGQRNEEREWEHPRESNRSDLPVWQSIHPEVSNSQDYSIWSKQTYVSEPRGFRFPRKGVNIFADDIFFCLFLDCTTINRLSFKEASWEFLRRKPIEKISINLVELVSALGEHFLISRLTEAQGHDNPLEVLTLI